MLICYGKRKIYNNNSDNSNNNKVSARRVLLSSKPSATYLVGIHIIIYCCSRIVYLYFYEINGLETHVFTIGLLIFLDHPWTMFALRFLEKLKWTIKRVATRPGNLLDRRHRHQRAYSYMILLYYLRDTPSTNHICWTFKD